MLKCMFTANRLSLHLSARSMATVAKALKYNQFGEPADVLNLCEEEIGEPKDNEVLVKIIAAPINPADINTIQGKYPVKPKFPATGGNEFVGEVMCVGSGVTKVQPGDRVVPSEPGLGTWTSHARYLESNVMKVSKKIGIVEAATITVNPCTAYRMLKDFVCLKPGDTIIQSGANSAVGQSVHQLCKAWKINSVGVIRNKPGVEDIRNYLKCLGATEVLTDEELRKTDIFKSKLKKPKLALDCIAGKVATEISRHLDQNGIMVTYGGMSREPLTIPIGSLIFKNHNFRGFWMTRWTKENLKNPEREKMLKEITDLMEADEFKGPVHELVPVKNYKEAVSAVLDLKKSSGKKFILHFENC